MIWSGNSEGTFLVFNTSFKVLYLFHQSKVEASVITLYALLKTQQAKLSSCSHYSFERQSGKL